MKRCLSVPSHYQNWLQIIDIHPRAISQNISKIWWQLLASPVLLGSQWVNPCLPSPMHDWAAEAAKHDPASSLKTASHQSALRNIMFRSREWSTCLLNWEEIYGYSYIWHITEHRLINITLHIHIRVNIWLAFSCIMVCIMIVSHTNRPDHFSQSPCTRPSCRLDGWLVGWLNRFIYRANIARAPKLPTLTG